MMSADNDSGLGPTEAEMNPFLEVWVTLGALAASVPDMRLGLMVGGNSHQHPGVVANMALTLDHIFGGRTVPGLGRLADQQSSAARYRVAVGQGPLRHARGSGGAVPCSPPVGSGSIRG